MESKVEMTLEECIKIIRENERLKAMLRNCTKQLKEKAEDSVEEYTINGLTKEWCDKALTMYKDELIRSYAHSHSLNEAIEDFPCFASDEIKNAFAEAILKKIKGRMGDLKDKE